MPIIGYFEGTDPVVLSKLTAQGVQTLPLSNGMDNHGKDINLVTREDGMSLIVGYLHKIVPVEGIVLRIEDVLQNCRVQSIPVCIIISPGDEVLAEKLLGEFVTYVQFTTSEMLFSKVMSIVG